MVNEQQQPQVDMGQVMGELVNRVRILESKQSLFAEKLLIMNENMLEEYKKMMDEVKKVNSQVVALKDDIGNMQNIMRHLTQEASGFAKQDDLKVLEKYINVWNPLNFVTEKDVLRLMGKEVKNAESDSSE
jgi:hypothetical protein